MIYILLKATLLVFCNILLSSASKKDLVEIKLHRRHKRRLLTRNCVTDLHFLFILFIDKTITLGLVLYQVLRECNDGRKLCVC